jgi:alanine racemase
MKISDYSTWLEIDLSAIQTNVGQLQRISGRPVMAVVKANGYGHGMLAAARAALKGGATWLAVARLEEALSLRDAGIAADVLVMGYTPPDQIAVAARAGVHVAVYDTVVAEAYSSNLKVSRLSLNVHLKIDSGMGRLGVFPENGLAFLHWLRSQPFLCVEGLFTHFACADEPQRSETLQQIERFELLRCSIEAEGIRPRILHAANSAAALNFPASRYDMVRCGIAIYGLAPGSEVDGLPPEFQPAATWKARLTSVKMMPSGSGIGYGHRYHTSQVERVGVISAGYADGFRRRLGNFVLIGGQRVPVLGNVCMDQSMVALDNLPDARVGDEVVLLGRQGSGRITAEEIGTAWGTINYEVVCGLANRLTRFYRE